MLERAYQSRTVDRLKALGFDASTGGLRIRLAREFGFCYGVDRAVDYAYQARRRFPDRRVFLSGEIIRIRDLGIEILEDSHDPELRFAKVGAADVVILPAFGVSVPELDHLKAKGCVLVDTTCGSVLNVWKKVHFYARDSYTVIIHGKHYHEETRATASQALTHPGGQYLCVRDVAETERLCEFILGRRSAAALMTETLKVQETLRRAIIERHGSADVEAHYRAFDTICSATQERQDAVLDLLKDGGLDVMIVIGGYNSSNTQALARMCAPRVRTFYIDNPGCVEATAIRHRPVGASVESRTEG